MKKSQKYGSWLCRMKINPDGRFNAPAVQKIARKISSKSITISTNLIGKIIGR